jgi:hypothetical protein
MDTRLEIAVSGCQYPDIDFAQGCGANALDLPIGKNSQELGLCCGGHFRNFIQEKRAFMSRFEKTAPCLVCPVKAPRSWPNNSLSKSVSVTAAQLIAINGRFVLGLLR